MGSEAPAEPRIGVHLELGRGLRRAAERAEAIGARTVQVFVDNPSAWRRRTAPPKDLDRFREHLAARDIGPVAVHASYLVNLGGPDRAFRRSSIDVLVSDMLAARGYGARMVNVHTGSHRDTTVADGLERVARGVAEVLSRVDDARAADDARATDDPGAADRAGAAERAGDGADGTGDPDAVPMLVLENSAGGGSSVGTTIEELAWIADRATGLGVPPSRLGFCLDVAHAWGAGVAMDDPDAIDAWIAGFDSAIGLDRLALIHFNDSRSERGSRTDRHVHVGAGRVGPRGMGHLIRHPMLRRVPFVLETPGMDVGYDRINLERARALVRGEALPDLPPEAFHLPRRSAKSAPDERDVDRKAGAVPRHRSESADRRRSGGSGRRASHRATGAGRAS